jgi:hypothetical protein
MKVWPIVSRKEPVRSGMSNQLESNNLRQDLAYGSYYDSIETNAPSSRGSQSVDPV